MSKKDRLFIFGDSWAENIFRHPNLEKELLKVGLPGIPYHLTDYLKFHYDVYNYGVGASSNENIIYQLSNLPEYEKNDRVLIIWSHFVRFSIYNKVGGRVNYGDFNFPHEDNNKSQYHAPALVYAGLKGRLQQLVLAEETSIDKLIHKGPKEELKFYNWITTILKNWSPIALTWEPTLAKVLNIPSIDYNSPIYENFPITLKDEYNYPDVHLGGKGNYLLYKYVLGLLDSEATPLEQLYRILDLDDIPKVLH